jgi:hopene-associated glycosyltransferase HpnB
VIFSALVCSALSCLIWIFLVFGRRGFWMVREPREQPVLGSARPRVVAVVPARNEADVIGRSVGSLLRSEYPVDVIVVDDHSTDGTAEAAGRSERLTVIHAAALPAGWTGKLWAVSQGIPAAGTPDYFLLTDADIEHGPENVLQLVARAESGGFDMVSLMVKLRCESLAEKALIPAFVFFFFKLYPPGPATRGAAGGCILIRRTALERIGGIARVRGELIDDCALAREVKRSGGRIWLGVTQSTRSIRDYGSFADVEQMISRTAFTQLGYSVWMLVGAVVGMAVTYLLPPVLAFAGYPLAMAAWGLMAIAYVPVLRFYGRSILWAPLLPLVALFYTAATVHSAVRYWRGKGGMWKGRVQAA